MSEPTASERGGARARHRGGRPGVDRAGRGPPARPARRAPGHPGRGAVRRARRASTRSRSAASCSPRSRAATGSRPTRISSAYVERFVLEGQHARLSGPALETLAIIAYKQPISRGQMSAIRGVNVEATLTTLLQRGYVQEVGRDPGPGAAVLYGTTPEFLERLGLASLDDLPPLGDFVPDASVVEALERGLRISDDPHGQPEPADAEAEAGADATPDVRLTRSCPSDPTASGSRRSWRAPAWARAGCARSSSPTAGSPSTARSRCSGAGSTSNADTHRARRRHRGGARRPRLLPPEQARRVREHRVRPRGPPDRRRAGARRRRACSRSAGSTTRPRASCCSPTTASSRSC